MVHCRLLYPYLSDRRVAVERHFIVVWRAYTSPDPSRDTPPSPRLPHMSCTCHGRRSVCGQRSRLAH
jgi:hypothetical protein